MIMWDNRIHVLLHEFPEVISFPNHFQVAHVDFSILTESGEIFLPQSSVNRFNEWEKLDYASIKNLHNSHL